MNNSRPTRYRPRKVSLVDRVDLLQQVPPFKHLERPVRLGLMALVFFGMVLFMSARFRDSRDSTAHPPQQTAVQQASDASGASVSGQTQPETRVGDIGSTATTPQNSAPVTEGKPFNQAQSDASRNAFLKNARLQISLPPEFQYTNGDDEEGKLQVLHGVDPQGGNRVVAYSYQGSASDADILKYVSTTAGISPAGMEELEPDGEISFPNETGFSKGRVFKTVDPATQQEVKAVLFTHPTTGMTYLLGLVGSPGYFKANEDRVDSMLGSTKPAP